MINVDNKEDIIFLQRLSDLALMSVERYTPSFTDFLDGRRLVLALQHLKGYDVRVVTSGGFCDAERKVVGIFPEDVYGYADEDELVSMFEYKALYIAGSGFSKFTHRDVMGSVLSLGIKRDKIGDIYVEPSNTASYIVLDKVAADYLKTNLDFIARDKVTVSEIEVDSLPVPERKYAVISGTVASERLDCIISLVTGLSREKSKTLITGGQVNVNHFEESRCDFVLSEGDILSVRGHGRFKIVEFPGVTRKGRDRVIIHKMI